MPICRFLLTESFVILILLCFHEFSIKIFSILQTLLHRVIPYVSISLFFKQNGAWTNAVTEESQEIWFIIVSPENFEKFKYYQIDGAR